MGTFCHPLDFEAGRALRFESQVPESGSRIVAISRAESVKTSLGNPRSGWASQSISRSWALGMPCEDPDVSLKSSTMAGDKLCSGSQVSPLVRVRLGSRAQGLEGSRARGWARGLEG